MAEVLDPVPAREPVMRGTPQLTAVWVRWLDRLRTQTLAAGGGGGTVPVSGITPVTSPRLIGRSSAGSGPAEEISIGAGLSLSGGTLANTGLLALGPTLSAIEALTGTADTMLYFTGTDLAALTPLTPLARTLLDDTTQAAMQTTLGVPAAGTVQPLDATLTALAGLATGANQLPYSTGTDTFAQTAFTALARTLLGNATAAGMQGTLGLGSAATQAYEQGTFTATGTGFTAAPTGTAAYARVGGLVVLVVPFLNATSNATTFTVTGAPSSLWSTRAEQWVVVPVIDNGAGALGRVGPPNASGVMTVNKDAFGAVFVGSGSKGITGITISYLTS